MSGYLKNVIGNEWLLVFKIVGVGLKMVVLNFCNDDSYDNCLFIVCFFIKYFFCLFDRINFVKNYIVLVLVVFMNVGLFEVFY